MIKWIASIIIAIILLGGAFLLFYMLKEKHKNEKNNIFVLEPKEQAEFYQNLLIFAVFWIFLLCLLLALIF